MWLQSLKSFTWPCRSLAAIIIVLLVSVHVDAREAVMGMSRRVYTAINEIQKLLEEKQYDEAIETLQDLSTKRLTGYEKAHILNLLGFTYYQLNRIEEALKAYEDALSQKRLPDSQIRGLLTTVAQLSLLQQNYKKAEETAIRLLQLDSKIPPDPASYVILAQAYIGQDNYDKAEKPLQIAIKMNRDQGKNPQESWLALLGTVYFQKENYKAMRQVLYELTELYPRESYLMNLAAVHGQLGEMDKQLALTEALMDDHRLKQGNHLLNLANLFLAQKLPYKAAKLLEAELADGRVPSNLRNLELVSQAWYLAGNEKKAIPPLEQAAELSGDGELYLRVARLYMDIYDWQNSERAVKKALQKGKLRDRGNALLLQGMALTRQEKLDAARKAFRKAVEFENTQKWAKQWLKYVDREEKRIASAS